jgi:hypothetical protein
MGGSVGCNVKYCGGRVSALKEREGGVEGSVMEGEKASTEQIAENMKQTNESVLPTCLMREHEKLKEN